MPDVIVDVNSLRSRTPSGNVIGLICLKVGEEHFPDSQWNDFPIIILGWWIAGLLEIAQGQADTFEGRFMDGPYSFVVEAVHGVHASIMLSGPESSHNNQTINLRALLVSAAAAGAELAHASRANGWSNADLTNLEALLVRAAA